MKITFLLNLDLKVKAGLFYAIHNRMKINNKQFECKFYNIIIVDSKPLALLKQMFRKRIYPKYIKEKYIIIDGVKYINIYYENCILDKFWGLFSCEHIRYKKLIKQISKDIECSDLIISHWGYPHGRIAYYIKEYLNKDYIAYYHGSDIHTYANSSSKNRSMILEIMEKAKKNIFIGKSLMKQTVEFGYKKNNIYNTRNGIDIEIFNMKNHNDRNKKKIIGFVGNLETIKRADFLPDIFKSIYYNNKDVSFLVIGDGSLRKKLEIECKEKGIPVNFTGRLSAEEVAKCMNELNIIILPSKNESWGSVILEANACGAYAIATNTGGIPEVVGRYGTIVNNNDNTVVNEICEAVTNTLNKNIDRKLISERAKKFTWQNICDKEYYIIKD
ncbi:glycosyltransferase [Clostridium beijerinckii]|uniref:Glycosyltransferase family 4 protein n=1 Tax=Clostridium beijerinckii TaxID=1520 RepID=A0A7X9XNT8_CLOBE|nr:glycosyltransferase [Clostridium beijerinckii]NMF04832.1 glycosyltransferase family 4 protein [Clostridium beijerinckii]